MLGRDGTYSVRPEKIHIDTDLAALGRQPTTASVSVEGTVAEVVYAGASTRFVVDLDAGVRLVAVQQNQQTSSMDVLDYRDAPVRLSWKKQHVVTIDEGRQPPDALPPN